MILLVSTIHVLVCLFLIMVVLLQQGKGADLSVFGGGGTQAAFGARGAATLLHKLTVIGFVGFILTTMAIGLFSGSRGASSVITDLPPATEAVVEESAVEESALAAEAVPVTEPATEATVGETPAAEADDAAAEATTDDGGQ